MTKALEAVETVSEGGWFIPAIQGRVDLKKSGEPLKELCRKWLEKNFKIKAEIGSMELLEQEEIDKDLGLLGIRFGFSNKKTEDGESVAFFDTRKLKGLI